MSIWCLRLDVFGRLDEVQTIHATNGGAITAGLANCCVNCVYTSCPPKWGTDLPIFWQSPLDGWNCYIISGDVETNPGPTTTHKQVWIAISVTV